MPTRRCAIYVRISVAQEASVSMDRQVEAAEQYAAARGWTVVEVFRDEGVSATHNKPENRAGWRALLESNEKFDAVLVWKIDRLARRVLDFLHADESLQARGAGIVAVEDPVDMTTAQGRAFAQILAVFGEMEAESIRARVKAARTHLLRSGRVVGGTVPYGWKSTPNPDGGGYVLAQDPDRIDHVRGMVDRVLGGASVYSTVQWLDEVGAPTPTGKGDWIYSTVERILRHPVLAGMVPFNPGNTTKARGTDVLRDADGLPVVDESIAIMPVGEWRAMVNSLDERATAQSLPRALRAKTSGLLSGLVYCADCETRMHRGTTQGRPGYSCPSCHQSITNFEHVVVDEFLRQKGERVRWSVIEEVHEGGAALLPEIEHRLDELDDLIRLAPDRQARQTLQAEQGNLLDLRDDKRAETPNVRYVPTRGTQAFGDDWTEAETVERKRAILDDAMERVWVRRGRPGRRTDAQVLARLTFDWKMPDDLGPIEPPSDKDLADWAK
ncbi:recombinase family protein [Nocardioides lijunqiniae]|uniref:recombinase family protein n=1 Tax=Nocardioides lijunqiniae TaxID=2760832 RepID=UPI0018778D4C|nr:recombinase family protein [Nocardioides lijunqiniae]